MRFAPPSPLQSQLSLLGCGSSGGGFTGALDALASNLDAAWSVSRRLLASYSGSLIRVRRSSDNAEQDIGCDASGNLDTTALLAFTGAGSGFVRTIYAQTGAKDLVQTTAAIQPRIVNSGVLDTTGGNSRPAACTTAANTQRMATAAFTTMTGVNLTLNAVIYTPAASGRLFGANPSGGNDSSSDGWLAMYMQSSTALKSYEGASDRASLTLATPLLVAASSKATAAGHTLRANGSSNTASFTGSAKNLVNYILWCYNPTNALSPSGSKFAEAAVWTADVDSSMAALISAQQTYFG